MGPTEASVLVCGETGTGKDSVARALHQLSSRSVGPFVVFDCAAVSPNLVESELFGHIKGAFTGADKARAGAMEQAEGGTLFLDEIGELPLELQPKLLRMLSAKEVRRVGGEHSRPTSVRVLAATHRDLASEVSAGRFRSDLYFRLAVATVVVPSLGDRLEDIPLLAQHFARELSSVDVRLTPATIAALQCHVWKGNVRELRNAVARVIALGSPQADAPVQPAEEPPGSYKEARDKLLFQFEHDFLAALLERSNGNISLAARSAKLSRSYFYKMLERHHLAPDET